MKFIKFMDFMWDITLKLSVGILTSLLFSFLFSAMSSQAIIDVIWTVMGWCIKSYVIYMTIFLFANVLCWVLPIKKETSE